MITVPAMWPFPALEFEEDIASLRLIALALMHVAKNQITSGLCANIEIELETNYTATEVFSKAMACAIGWKLEATKYAADIHGIDCTKAALMRPAWAAHIARSIYEQIGA